MSDNIYLQHHCVLCQNPFSKASGSKRKFCSDDCRNTAISQHQQQIRPVTIVTCLQCHTQVKGAKRKFCSSSCAATYNSTGRVRTEDSKVKVATKMRQLASEGRIRPKTIHKGANNKNYKHGRYVYDDSITKPCSVCNKPFKFPYKTLRKTCSAICLTELNRSLRVSYLKAHAGTFNWIHKGKMNYFETQFDLWLQSIGYIPQQDYVALSYVMYNDEQNTHYIMDFWFPALNLNIELDGSHHERPEQVVRDTTRDEWLNRIHNIDVIRIKGREWSKSKRRDQIKHDLVVGALERSQTSMCSITVSTP